MPSVEVFLRNTEHYAKYPFITLSGTLGRLGDVRQPDAGLLIAIDNNGPYAQVQFGADDQGFLREFNMYLDVILGGPPNTVGPRNAMVSGHLARLGADGWQLIKVAFFAAAEGNKAIVIKKKRKGYSTELIRID